MTRLATLVLLLVLPGFGCATPKPPPAPVEDRSIVAISVKTRPPVKIGKELNLGVYFVRLDDESTLTTDALVQSNYALGDYAFLVNAPPGRYAAVASQVVKTVETDTSSTVYQGSNVEVTAGVGFQAAVGKTTYFPDQVIRQTIVEVPPGGTAFMGDFILDTSLGLGGADPTQHYYRARITPDQQSGIKVNSLFSSTAIYRGSPHQADQSPGATDRFLAYSREMLDAGGWTVAPGSVATAPPAE